MKALEDEMRQKEQQKLEEMNKIEKSLKESKDEFNYLEINLKKKNRKKMKK